MNQNSLPSNLDHHIIDINDFNNMNINISNTYDNNLINNIMQLIENMLFATYNNNSTNNYYDNNYINNNTNNYINNNYYDNNTNYINYINYYDNNTNNYDNNGDHISINIEEDNNTYSTAPISMSPSSSNGTFSTWSLSSYEEP